MPYNMLHLLSTNTFNGAERVALDICKNLDKEIFYPIAVCAGYELQAFFEKESIECHSLDISKMSIRQLLILRKLIKSKDIKLIHAHDVRASIAAKISACYLKVIVISHIHVEYQWLKRRSILKLIDKLFRNRYKLSLACSNKVKEFYCKHNDTYNKDKVFALPNSFDFHEFNKLQLVSKWNLKEANNLEKLQYVFGYLGRLIDVKGVDLIIESFSLFHKKYSSSILVIVGEGEEKEKLRQLAGKYNLSDKVYFMGYRKDIYNWINIFDAFILPSKREGLPMTILEAMAMKKIVIATAIGGIPELIVNNYNGILLESRNCENLYKAMEYVYENEDEVNRMVENGYEHLKINYSMEEYINKLQEIYLFSLS